MLIFYSRGNFFGIHHHGSRIQSGWKQSWGHSILAYSLSSIDDVRSFHGLASFYKRFIRYFSTVTALVTEYSRIHHSSWSQKCNKPLKKSQESSLKPWCWPCHALRKSLKWSVMHSKLGLVEFSLRKVFLLPTLVRNYVIPREGISPMTRNSMPSFSHLSIRVTT